MDELLKFKINLEMFLLLFYCWNMSLYVPGFVLLALSKVHSLALDPKLNISTSVVKLGFKVDLIQRPWNLPNTVMIRE